MKLVFDIGATSTRIASVSNGELGSVVRFSTDSSQQGILQFIEKLQGVAAGQTIEAMAGCLPAQLGPNGDIVLASNLPQWQGQNLQKIVESTFHCSLQLHNDMVMCGTGEAWRGSGSSDGVMAYMTVSTGSNAARFINGQIDATIPWFELGYQLVSGGPREVHELSRFVSGRALQERMHMPPAEITDPRVWDQVSAYLARAIYNMRLYWAPEIIVLGGSMMRDIMLTALEDHLALFPDVFPGSVELRLSTLGDTAGLLGSLTYLEKHL